MSWPTTLTTLATLVANRRCYRENVYRSNRSPPLALTRNYDETRDTPLCAHSTLPASLWRLPCPDLTRFERFLCLPYPYPWTLPHRVFILAHGQWSRPSRTSFRSNRFLQLQPSPVKRTGPAKRPPTVAATQRGLHISLMLLMHASSVRRG